MLQKTPNFGRYRVRKWFTYVDEALANETGASDDGGVLRKIVVGAAIINPYAGQFSKSLQAIVDGSEELGVEFGRRIKRALGSEMAQSYGKACIVGTMGEYEHGNAFLTTLFADPIRKELGGATSWIPSTGKRGPVGTTIDIPLAHLRELYVRSHYDTVTLAFNDAPNPDEVIVAFGVGTRGRIHARLGGLAADRAKG